MQFSKMVQEKFWSVSLYVTDDVIEKLYICDVKLSQNTVDENGQIFRHIELSNCVIR